MKCAVIENLVLMMAKNDTLALGAPNSYFFTLIHCCGSPSQAFCEVERCLSLGNWNGNEQTNNN
jgi:hypothetical protein